VRVPEITSVFRSDPGSKEWWFVFLGDVYQIGVISVINTGNGEIEDLVFIDLFLDISISTAFCAALHVKNEAL